jgi:HK97 family phage prohead protease
VPWHVAESGQCPATRPWAVIKDSDGSVVACHVSKDSADKQVAALYANEGSRMSDDTLPTRPCERMFALDDLHVRSDGSGRVVEAYAAVFGIRTEVMDQEGHYYETLLPSSFDRTIQHKGTTFGVLFNHGRTIDGTPNPQATLPIGVPQEVHSDERGVFTATRYLDNPLADWVLGAIKDGAIRAQSFSGRFMRSARSHPEGRTRGKLPLITRHEVDMREYGPAVFAAYPDAAILGTRAAEQFVRTLLAKPEDERLGWLQQFEGFATPLDSATPAGAPSGDGLAVEADDSQQLHSVRPSLRSRIRAARITRGWEQSR